MDENGDIDDVCELDESRGGEHESALESVYGPDFEPDYYGDIDQ